MMKIRLEVKHLDGSGADVEASVPDFIAFERRYDSRLRLSLATFELSICVSSRGTR